MKNKSLILLACAAFALASCGGKVSDTTRIEGSFEGTPSSKVIFKVPSSEEITAAVSDGKFSAEIPACLVEQSEFKSGNIRSRFISDGTRLTVLVKKDNTVEFTSKSPKASLQTRNAAFDADLSALQKEYEASLDTVKDSNPVSIDALADIFEAKASKKALDYFNSNKDNFLGVRAVTFLKGLGNVKWNQVDSLIALLDPKVKENTTISSLSKLYSARKATAEGMKFADLEVDGEKLSDYAGKGKYTLVHFTSSWGPAGSGSKKVFKALTEVSRKYAGDQLDIIGIAVSDKPKSYLDTAKVYGLDWKQLVKIQNIEPYAAYGFEYPPLVMLLSPDGVILKRDLKADEIEAEVARYVKPKE